MPYKLIMLAVAGGLGAIARYGLSGIVHHWTGTGFPWGTLVVNVAGSFVFGLVFALAASKCWIGEETRVVVLVGFVGAFTTFSSFAFETHEMIAASRWSMAAVNIAAQNAAGLPAVLLGLAAGRALGAAAA